MNIVEKVALIFGKAIADDHGKFSREAPAHFAADYEEEARAAIKATLEHLKVNPSKEMLEIGNYTIRECIDSWNYDSDAGFEVEQRAAFETFGAMIDQALKELE